MWLGKLRSHVRELFLIEGAPGPKSWPSCALNHCRAGLLRFSAKTRAKFEDGSAVDTVPAFLRKRARAMRVVSIHIFRYHRAAVR